LHRSKCRARKLNRPRIPQNNGIAFSKLAPAQRSIHHSSSVTMRCALLILLCAFSVRAADYHPSLPPIGSLEGLGVNIHFTDPKPGELETIAAAGFKWVRMDLTWAATERSRGEYDFSAYDRLAAALEKNQLRAVFILDYGNPLYAEPNDRHPFTSRVGTAEFREAYAKWAAAAVSQFKGKRYLWELWNEPNIAQFWKPKPNATDYMQKPRAKRCTKSRRTKRSSVRRPRKLICRSLRNVSKPGCWSIGPE